MTLRPPHARHVHRRRRRRSRGQSLVEFALVIPIFLLILSGIMDFGFLLYSRMTVINSAREGARAVVAYTDPTLVGQIVDVATDRTTGASVGLLTDSMVNVTCVPLTGVAGPRCSTNSFADAKPGDAVKVTVTYPYRPFFPLLFGQTINMSSTVQMSLE